QRVEHHGHDQTADHQLRLLGHISIHPSRSETNPFDCRQKEKNCRQHQCDPYQARGEVPKKDKTCDRLIIHIESALKYKVSSPKKSRFPASPSSSSSRPRPPLATPASPSPAPPSPPTPHHPDHFLPRSRVPSPTCPTPSRRPYPLLTPLIILSNASRCSLKAFSPALVIE